MLEEVRSAIATLESVTADFEPRCLDGPAATQLVGGAGEWRVRTGDYRIVYEINDGELLVLVLAVGHRREIYRRN